MATATAYTTQTCCTHTTHNYDRSYLLFSLPSLGSQYTITNATLNLYSLVDLGGSMGVTANTSNKNYTWTAAGTAAATLTGYTLDSGNLLQTADYSGVGANTWFSWVVLGLPGTWGVANAYALGTGYCSIILTNSIYSTAGSTVDQSSLTNGNNSSSTDASFTNTTGNNTHSPYLTITYTAYTQTTPRYSNIINGVSVGGIY